MCDKCGKNNFLWSYSHARDDNFYHWNAKEKKTRIFAKI